MPLKDARLFNDMLGPGRRPVAGFDGKACSSSRAPFASASTEANLGAEAREFFGRPGRHIIMEEL
jgi:hypothetical protein